MIIKLMAMVKRKLLNCNFEQDVAYFMTFSWKLEIVLHLYSYWLGRNVFGWNIVRVLQKLSFQPLLPNGTFLKVLQVSKEKIFSFISMTIIILHQKHIGKRSMKIEPQESNSKIRRKKIMYLPLGKYDWIKTWTYI